MAGLHRALQSLIIDLHRHFFIPIVIFGTFYSFLSQENLDLFLNKNALKILYGSLFWFNLEAEWAEWDSVVTGDTKLRVAAASKRWRGQN